ncbi:hypothetical protein SDC9_151901 [bioreactor metagenome]|uniref:Uncharacterized protein n=1 Tax=bioreactor metagenome TaxID=1076179 RepID=A0A645ETA5_9ZZZZ
MGYLEVERVDLSFGDQPAIFPQGNVPDILERKNLFSGGILQGEREVEVGACIACQFRIETHFFHLIRGQFQNLFFADVRHVVIG